ncbi:MAG: efflux RND transporter permease subunit [Acidobacteria bacterium]|nr:MAG: efflux RND transporter permease subunit [Acidobacteriota bacterium]
MNLSEIFIRRPVMTTLVMLGILLFGIMAYRFLPVSDLPSVDYPTITVRADLPGASPDTMASSVATPLERQFSTIAGLDSMSSTNTQGSTQISLQFDLSRNIDAAAQDVQSMITQAQGQLPPNMPSPPTFRKVNPADQPIIYMAVWSDTLPLYTTSEYADTMMAQRISMISGVAQVQVFGEQKYAVRVQFDPKALAARKIGIDEATQAIQQANVNLPTGTLYGSHKAFVVQAEGQLNDAAAYRPVIIAYRNGAPVRLDEVANVVNGSQSDKIAMWFGQHRAMVVAIQRQPGTNTVEVVDNVRKLLPSFRSEFPASINFQIQYDRSQTIRDSINDVKFTLYLTLCLVILVIFIFLRNVSATIIPSLALPMSIIGTFAVMYLAGYTVDNLSLMALVLAVGFVVDDAIVMLENIVRHMELGESVMEAALNGSKEISFTILSMTLSLTAVFIPVLFMSGIMGRLLHEFAVTIMSAVLVSGLVSLTLTPMLCSRFLRHPRMQKHGHVFEVSERYFNYLRDGYDWSLRTVLRYRFAVLVISILILALTGYLFVLIPKGFLPSEDSGGIFAFSQAAQGTSFNQMKKIQRQVADVVGENPNVSSIFALAGAGGPSGGGNSGIFFCHLKNHPSASQEFIAGIKRFFHIPHKPFGPNYRVVSTDEVIQQLRPKLAAIPGVFVFMQNPPPIQLSAHLTKSQYQYSLEGPNTAELYQVSKNMEAQIRKLPGFLDVTSDLEISNPQVNVHIDRDKAKALGVTAYQIESALTTAYGQGRVSTIYAPNNEYWVISELEPQYQANPDDLSLLYIRSTSGQLVPLSTVSSMSEGLGPLSVNHFGQLPSVTISFNLAPGVALGDAVNGVDRIARDALPADISASFEGTAQQFQSSLVGLGILLLATVLVIYLVLGILYESFIHPITILSGLPSAALGALVTLMAFNMELDLYGFVGIIMLIGIVKKNAIMMIDFALDAERTGGKSTAEAIYHGAIVRFRPIMMTTFAALMGILPIALGLGAGAESRRPLGMVVVGGLVFSQIITLYITPVYYTYLDQLQHWLGKLFQRRPAEGDIEAPGPIPESVLADTGERPRAR